MRLVGYIRVSRVMGREGATFQSPSEQREAIEHIVALTPGAEVVEWIEELDASGGTMDRPGAQHAIRAVDSGAVDGIVMAYLSRWARTPSALEKIDQWARDGKVFLSAAERIDTTTSHGMFALGVLLLVAKLELDRYAESWGRSTRNAVDRGVAIRIPYGYKRGADSRLVPNEPAASVVRRMFRLRAAGQGVAAIAHTLDADGIRPPNSTHWTRQTVRAMLRVRTYLGEAKYGEHVTIDAHPALVDVVTWKAAQTERAPSWTSSDRHLLTGLVRCAGCGYIMGAGDGRGGRRYSCGRVTATGRCPSPTAVLATVIEPYVTGVFLDRYGHAQTIAAETSPELADLGQALARARVEFEAWRDDSTMRDVLGEDNYRAGLIARHVAVDQAERAHDAAVREARADTLTIDATQWDAMTVAERRVILRAGIDDVLLGRAGRTGTHAPIAGRCVVRFVGEREPSDLPRQGSPRRTVR